MTLMAISIGSIDNGNIGVTTTLTVIVMDGPLELTACSRERETRGRTMQCTHEGKRSFWRCGGYICVHVHKYIRYLYTYMPI